MDNLPGLAPLREAVANQAEAVIEMRPKRKDVAHDALAGLTAAVSNVPDGMASGVLIGVNPLYGLYANIMGPMVGALFLSTPRMVIVTTSVTALVAGQSLGDRTGAERSAAVFLLVILSGVIQIIFGLLRLDRATRFVSHSVMTGFLAGVAVLLILSQIPTISGIEAQGTNQVLKAWSALRNFGDANPLSMVTAAIAFLLAITLNRTKVGKFSTLVAITIPAIVVFALGWDNVKLVQDIGQIPRGIPSPVIPEWKEAFNLLTAAASLAVVILIQGAGVSQSVPMPQGERRKPSRDFIAQGAANIASGFFRGVPVGGSLSMTALSLVAGSKSRWTSIFMGIVMAIIVVGVPGLVSRVAMPALGALLIVAGIKSIHRPDIAMVWRSGWPARIVIIMSFVATLVLPIQLAVAVSVGLSALIYLVKSSMDITLVQLIQFPDGRIREQKAPANITGGKPMILDIYGSLFFAGARTLAGKLPRPTKDKHPVVILRLRGHIEAGATLATVLERYEEELHEVDGRLYVTGLSNEILRHLKGTGKIRLHAASPILGESTRKALADAQAWLVSREDTARLNKSG